jgi:curved DNA-binding protein CbpA
VRLKLNRILTEVGLRRKPAWPAHVDDVPDVPEIPKAPQGPEVVKPGEQVISALSEPAAMASFEATAEVPADVIPTDAPTEPLILDALRGLGDAERIRKMLGNLDQRLVTTTALADEQRTLTLTEGYLLSRIDGQCTGREVLQLVPLAPAEAERTLAGLLLTGRVAQQAGPARTAKPAKKPPRKPKAERKKKAPPPKLVPPSEPPLEPPLELSLEDELPATPQARPGPGDAPPAEATTDSGAAQPSAPETEADAVPASAQAPEHATLTPESAPEPTAETTPEPAPEPQPEETPEDTAEPAAEPTPEPAPLELTPEAEAERHEILEFFQSLPLRNHFEVLGAERGSSDADLRRAHVGLVKRYHPDMRREAYLEDLHDVLEAIFIRIGEAWEVLGNAKSRAAYEARLGPAPSTAAEAKPPEPGPAEPAAEADEEVGPALAASPEDTLRRARILLAQAQYWDAIQMLETAVPHLQHQGHQHRGRILLARAYAENPKWVHRAVETLQEVVNEDPENAEAHYELGRLYKARSLNARAQAAFRKVLELRPGNKKVAAELREVESEGGGLLRRLFGGGDKSA